MDEWTRYDDPLKAEIKQELMQDMEYRKRLEDGRKWAVDFYLEGFPNHKRVLSLVNDVAEELWRERPDYGSAGADKYPEIRDAIGAKVNQRLKATLGDQQSSNRGEGRFDLQKMGYEQTDEQRAEALREDVEQSWKRRQSP